MSEYAMSEKSLGSSTLEAKKQTTFKSVSDEFNGAIRDSEKIPFPVLRLGLVPGQKIVDAEVKMPGKQGYLPAPEKKRIAQYLLQGDVAPRPTRYGAKEVRVTVPALVPGMGKEIAPAVPMALLVVFLHADIGALLFETEKSNVIWRGMNTLESFKSIRNELLRSGASNVGLKVFIKIPTVVGTSIIPLSDFDGQPLRVGTTSNAEIEERRKMIDEEFEKAAKRSVEIPASYEKNNININQVWDVSSSEDMSEWIKERFTLSPSDINQRETGYFPATVIIDIDKNENKITSIPGRTIQKESETISIPSATISELRDPMTEGMQDIIQSAWNKYLLKSPRKIDIVEKSKEVGLIEEQRMMMQKGNLILIDKIEK